MERNLIYVKSTHTERQNGKHRCEAAFTERVWEKFNTQREVATAELYRMTSVWYSFYILYYQYWLEFFFLLKIQECLHSLKKKHQHQTSWVTFLSYWRKLYFNSDLEIPIAIFSNLTLKLPFWLTVCLIYKWRKKPEITWLLSLMKI